MRTPADELSPSQMDPKAMMHSIIQRIATGPDLSKDISQEEARYGMHAVLNGDVDPVQAAIFLIALRMKRESYDENKGILDGIRDFTDTVTAPVDEVVDIADPYDGYNRSLPVSPFLPALLAACDVPTVSHGLDAVGPKYGITHRHVLQAAGLDVDLTASQAAARIGDDAIGWAYVDQRQFCKPLHNYIDMRAMMIKRTVITTIEVLTGPIRGQQKTHLVTGYVHKPYPPIYAMLARHSGYDSALLVRGVEGGVIASLRQAGKFYQYHDMGEETSIEFDPATIGIQQQQRAVPFPMDAPLKKHADEIELAVDLKAMAKVAANEGIAALEGKQGLTYDALLYSASVILWHLKHEDSVAAAARRVRAVLDSAAAVRRLG